MAYAFIAMAAAFGGVAASVLLTKPPPPPIVVAGPAPTTTSVAESKPDKPVEAPQNNPEEQPPEVANTPPEQPGAAPRPVAAAGGAKPKPSASATTSAPIDMSGFNLNVPGPKAQAPTTAQTNSGGQLSQGEISGVVAQNQPLVRRRCWLPALDARAGQGPANARVNARITIGASGSVDSVSASGAEKDFPGLSSCIASRMKGWRFPASGGPTTVNVPFVFAGQ